MPGVRQKPDGCEDEEDCDRDYFELDWNTNGGVVSIEDDDAW